MGLICNQDRRLFSPFKIRGGSLTTIYNGARGERNFGMTGDSRGLARFAGNLAARPEGCRHPSAWTMPQKPGGLSSRNNLTGSGDVSDADIWAVKLAEAALVGQGDLSAIGGLIVQAIADLTGSGEITSANVQAFLAAVASLTGSGGISAADLEGFGAVLAAIAGSGTLAGSTLTGIGELDADLVVTGTGLTTANVGQAVWAAIAAANNIAGTMGEKLNDAGSASNPWTEVIESGYTAAEILRLLAAISAGKVSGAGTGTETFKGIDGTTDRVVSTVDENGNRTAITLDGT